MTMPNSTGICLDMSRTTYDVLSYYVSEPGEWSMRAIAEDMGGDHSSIRYHGRKLRELGLIEKRPGFRNLFPTPAGKRLMADRLRGAA